MYVNGCNYQISYRTSCSAKIGFEDSFYKSQHPIFK